jgi:transcriptional regulator with XRE-family HTH domain
MATDITASRARRLTFALRLRQAMDEQSISIRELSRRLSPDNPEGTRSLIHKWLKGKHVPSRTSRRAVAIAMGVSPDHFLEDDDSEED